MLARPANQQPSTMVMSCRDVGPEDGDMVAGYQAAGLQSGADDPGLVVDLAPRDERFAGRRSHGGAHETDPGGPVGCGDDAIDDAHVRRLGARRHDLQP